MLSRSTPIPDHTIARRVNSQLSNRGLRAPCRVEAESSRGTVTLSGLIQHAFQRQTALNAARSVEGVREVVDHLKILPPRT